MGFYNLSELLNKSFKALEYNMLSYSLEPQILIVHTHTTESYSKEGDIFYSNNIDEISRSFNSGAMNCINSLFIKNLTHNSSDFNYIFVTIK